MEKQKNGSTSISLGRGNRSKSTLPDLTGTEESRVVTDNFLTEL